jgi:hypothetical protein
MLIAGECRSGGKVKVKSMLILTDLLFKAFAKNDEEKRNSKLRVASCSIKQPQVQIRYLAHSEMMPPRKNEYLDELNVGLKTFCGHQGGKHEVHEQNFDPQQERMY